jgi:hypothetical protein
MHQGRRARTPLAEIESGGDHLSAKNIKNTAKTSPQRILINGADYNRSPQLPGVIATTASLRVEVIIYANANRNGKITRQAPQRWHC